MAKPQLRREGGVTQLGRRLRKRLGCPIRLELQMELQMEPDGALPWYRARVMYDSGDSHTFTGFSWGPSPEFCQNNDIPLTIHDIVKLDNTSTVMA